MYFRECSYELSEANRIKCKCTIFLFSMLFCTDLFVYQQECNNRFNLQLRLAPIQNQNLYVNYVFGFVLLFYLLDNKGILLPI